MDIGWIVCILDALWLYCLDAGQILEEKFVYWMQWMVNIGGKIYILDEMLSEKTNIGQCLQIGWSVKLMGKSMHIHIGRRFGY